jgi:hypothetical protein
LEKATQTSEPAYQDAQLMIQTAQWWATAGDARLYDNFEALAKAQSG